jgi:hypothetical protein
MFRHIVNALTLVSISCCFSTLAFAQASINENQETATLYVDVVNGSDGNPGTQQLPLQTILKAAQLAEQNNQNNIGTQVNIQPGLYRENIDLQGLANDTALPETFQAVTPGTVFISGADPYTNWAPTSQNPSIYSTAWTYTFGLCSPLVGGAPPQPDITLRREMTFVNGTQMTQVLSLAQMLQGTFYVDEAQGQIYLWPPSGVDPNSADVEVADRYKLWIISNKNGVVLRGLTFEYSADCVGAGAAEMNNAASSNVLFDTDSFIWNNASGLHIFTINPQNPESNYTIQNVIANHNGERGIATDETLNGLWQNIDASFNDWRGEQGSFTAWSAAGIYPFGDHVATYNNITLDYNLADGTHLDTSFENFVGTNISSRNNLISGMMVEKSDGPVTISNLVACNNALPGFEAYTKISAEGGFELRDSADVTLTQSMFYNNGATGITIQGIPGGLPYVNWQTGQNQLMQNVNFVNTYNTFVGMNSLEDQFLDSYLGGADWTLFQSTLTSNNNVWWNSATDMTFIVPITIPPTTTNFAGWQQATLQDQNSSWQPWEGGPPASCSRAPDMPDFWFINNNPTLTLDASGQAVSNFTSVPLDFTQQANLTYDGISEVPGLSAQLSETTMNMGDVVTFQANAATSTAPGTYQVTLLANSGSTTRTSTFFLTVPTTSLRLSTTTLNFGNVQVGQQSSPQTVTMTNFGQSPIAISRILVGVGFSQTNNCPASLPPNVQCAINVVFTPPGGVAYNAELSIVDADPTSPQEVALTGAGLAVAQVTLSSHAVSFGSEIFGVTSAPQNITLTNTGTIAYVINSIAFTGNQGSDFAQTNTCGSSVPVGGSCTISLTFTPDSLSTCSGTMIISDNTMHGETTALLSGIGVTSVKVSPTSITFATEPVGFPSPALSVTLQNLGNTLSVTGITFGGTNPGDFTETDNCTGGVPANSSCTITITFTPQAQGARTAVMQIADGDPTSPQSVTLRGTGESAIAQVTLSSRAVSFGSQIFNTTSGAHNITLTNIGKVPYVINSITFAGNQGPDFAQTDTCGSGVPVGGNCTISLTFTPESLSTCSGTMVISDNTSTGQTTASLGGTGLSSVKVSPTSILFQAAMVGQSAPSQTVTLQNLGNTLSVSGITFGGTNPGDFTETDNCTGGVPADSSCTITVTFTPQAKGARTAIMQIADGDPSSPQSVTLRGTGNASIAQVKLSPTSVAFGSQVFGTTSAAQTVTLTNTGTVAYLINSITFAGSQAADFAQTDNCGSSVPVGGSCTFNITFTPESLRTCSGDLVISDNTSKGETVVPLTGTSLSSVSVTPTSLAFQSVMVGLSAPPLTVTLQNLGNTLPVTGIIIAGADAADFSETNNCGNSVPAGGSCAITITFTPQAQGIRTATMQISDADPSSPQSVTLKGTGEHALAQVTISPSSVMFGSQIFNTTSAPQTVTLTNIGPVAYVINSITITGHQASDFVQSNNTCGSGIPVGGSCTISLIFTPESYSSCTGSLIISDNTKYAQTTATLNGNGLSSVIVAPTSITFQAVPLGQSAPSQTVTFQNLGNALSISGIVIGGTDPADFSQTNNCGNSVPALGSCTITITFAPQAQGGRTATMQITDADPTSPQNVMLRGSGQP